MPYFAPFLIPYREPSTFISTTDSLYLKQDAGNVLTLDTKMFTCYCFVSFAKNILIGNNLFKTFYRTMAMTKVSIFAKKVKSQ